MLSALFRTSRTVRLPVRDGPLNIQRVKLHQRLKRPAFLSIATPLVVFIIVQTSPYWLPSDLRRTVDSVNDDYEKAKKDVSSKSNQKQFSEEWQQANQRIRGTTSVDVKTQLSQTTPGTISLRLPFKVRKSDKVVPYTAADPEWKEYVKLQGDSARLQALFNEIAKMTFLQFARERDAPQKAKEILFTKNVQTSLAVKPLLYRPRPYEMASISMSPKGFALVWRDLPESNGSKLYRLTHPKVFFEAFSAALGVFCTVSYKNAKAYLSRGESIKKTSPTLLEVLRGPSSSTRSDDLSNPSASSSVKQAPESSGTKDPATTTGPLSSILVNKDTLMRPQKMVLENFASESALQQARSVFRSTWYAYQVAAWQEVPTGGVIIEGRIDLRGTKGFIRLEVQQIYLPKEDKFLGAPVILTWDTFPESAKWFQESENFRVRPGWSVDKLKQEQAKLTKLKKELEAEDSHLLKELSENRKKILAVTKANLENAKAQRALQDQTLRESPDAVLLASSKIRTADDADDSSEKRRRAGDLTGSDPDEDGKSTTLSAHGETEAVSLRKLDSASRGQDDSEVDVVPDEKAPEANRPRPDEGKTSNGLAKLKESSDTDVMKEPKQVRKKSATGVATPEKSEDQDVVQRKGETKKENQKKDS